VVTDVRIDEGHYAQAGQPLMTFISATDVWVEADMKENNISNIKVGDSAEIVLDVAPGRVFPGKVTSVGYGVGQGQNASLGTLRSIEGKSGWLRDAQRFPAIIEFSDDSTRGLRRAGGQADVIVYTGDHAILNVLGWLWVRLMSVLSYAY
jgi:multidrug resistance efflux pump